MPANDTPAADIQALKADLAALRDDMSALSKSLLRGGAKKARAARAAVEQQVSDATESVEELVQDRPLTSLAIAFGAGALVAALLCRR